ncbi:hypothetical protein ABPG74_009592 [Tetrahymena malaccensis]
MKLNSKAVILSLLFIHLSYGQTFLSVCSSIKDYFGCQNTDGCQLVQTPEMQCYGNCYTYDQTDCSKFKICQWQDGQCSNISTCKSLLSQTDCISQKPCYWDYVWDCEDIQKKNGSSYNSALGALFITILVFFI